MMMAEQVIDMVATKLGKPVEEVCMGVNGCVCICAYVGVIVWVCMLV